MKIQLSSSEVRRYRKPVAGKGGFQTLLRRIAKSINPDGILDVSQADLEKLLRHSFAYGQGGFQERTKPTARRMR
jgi:hypothetical protein